MPATKADTKYSRSDESRRKNRMVEQCHATCCERSFHQRQKYRQEPYLIGTSRLAVGSRLGGLQNRGGLKQSGVPMVCYKMAWMGSGRLIEKQESSIPSLPLARRSGSEQS